MAVIATIFSAAFALAGRWLQLHPERVFPEGFFTGQSTLGARVGRAQIVLLGTFMVAAGTFFAIIALVIALPFHSDVLLWTAIAAGSMAGLVAAIYVRKEAKARLLHKSKSPYGWWP